MKEEVEPTKVLDREGKKEAEENRTILEDDVEIREICTDLNFEINLPGSVLATLNVHPEKGSVRFVEENGRVYIEKVKTEEIKAEEIHEGTIQIMVYCNDPDDQAYRCSEQVDEKQIARLNLHAGDIVQYKITDQGVQIIGVVSIKKEIKKLQE